jgi:tetratricopeptide (TPR) repeat protein
MEKKVKVWEEEIRIPTYGVGVPEKNPMFLEKRVYQGSSGAVYPYPVIEKIEDTCEDKPYHALFLENEYLKIMILPELGGRIQMAYDKVGERHFIYYNRVIKPALVGLTGPWISGGIEFNWPQHHRPSTFMPVDFRIETAVDGSATVWVSERERMFHQKGMAGFKLSPGRAVLEIQGKLYNPTPLPQTFLWWANPAVAVNEHYQSVFPADVNAVFDHGKRDVSNYPIATGTYYKVDYSAGVDISRYKNIPVPTSYMAIKSRYDFVGGYENDTRAGVLHVANHHLSPGKKQWTWGNGDFGQAWDRNLTDADGPYIELMTGVFTDNQPDFSWLQPYEEKTFTQYFMPYRELGVVKNASADLLMNIEPDENGTSRLKVFATSEQKQLHVIVRKEGALLFEATTDLSPSQLFEATVATDGLTGVEVLLRSATGKTLLSWQPEAAAKALPEAAKPAAEPADTASTEQLYLTGLHLEQYRHATYQPVDYYREALRRDPSDVRNNNAMGLWLIRKGQFAQAEPFLRRAVETLTQRNPNPCDGEPVYNLGLSLKYQEKYDEACECFYKACWNGAWQDAGYFSLAQISCIREDWETALSEIDRSLIRNRHNHRARHLKTTILHRLGRTDEALLLVEDSLRIDAFNMGCRFERYLLTQEADDLEAFNHIMRRESHNYMELAVDYASAGCWQDALAVLNIAGGQGDGDGDDEKTDVMILYYKAWCLFRLRFPQEMIDTVRAAERMQPGCCFPNQLEAILALQTVTACVDHTPKALYLLGNLWYDKRQYPEAIAAWERSAAMDDTFPTVWRNLALAYFNKLNRKDEAVAWMEKAFALDTSDARLLMELDQLYKRLNRTPESRLAFLEQYKETAWQRDDVYLEYITLLNRLERHEEAVRLIDARKFHPWEGGEGKAPEQYRLARVELAKRAIEKQDYATALAWLDECYVYPHNLGEGKLYGAQENDLDYYKGCALAGLGRTEEANAFFEKASQGDFTLSAAMYYNDRKPEKIFFQGLAFRQLGQEDKARNCFNALISYGEQHMQDTFKMDYFAVSLPDLQIWEEDMDEKNRLHCRRLIESGRKGLCR